ncbi:hypothetical protein LTR97_001931 [Elasticomyces elasticus]|uniref:Uncharacterized protein n=1 Tax=Elasticomyces elasticus TaxID=574655 RepID=A0AAN7WGC1_9PEZI|nr:hypothetical protein LTR97_001931 [Elasticomyces elasticus]
MPHSGYGNSRVPRHRQPYNTQPRVYDAYGTGIWQSSAQNTTVDRPEPLKGPLFAERQKDVVPFVGLKDLNPNLTGLNEAVVRYNNINKFFPLTDVSSEVLAQRTVLRTRVEGARAALIKAVADIDSAMRDLGAAAASDSSRLPSLNQHKHWYEQGDLLSLSEDDMCKALQAHPPTDAAHFANYVRSRISDSIDTCAREAPAIRHAWDHSKRGDSEYGYWKVDRDPTFARKALRLIFTLLQIKDGGAFYAFHDLVWAQANLLRLDWYLPVTLADIETQGNLVDHTLEVLLDNASHNEVAMRVDLGMFGQVSFKTATYYNVAQASHMFDSVWKQRECEEDDEAFYEDIYDARGKSVGGCWHAYNEHLTGMLNEHAYEEVEHCVYVATAHVLPPELVEEVLEYALMLEGMSINYEVRDPKTGRTKAKYVEWCRFISEKLR